MITQELLHELFDYADGKLIWKVSNSNRITIGDTAGCQRPDGYSVIWVAGRLQLLHRLIFLYHKGYLPKRVDHIDRDRTNSRIDNLRDLTPSENAINSDVSTSIHGLKGVTRNTRNSAKYVAQIKKNYRTIYLGSYDTAEAAHQAYIAARYELYPGICA